MILEPGRTLMHYRLVEKVGEGGMGVVWRAIDVLELVAGESLDRMLARGPLPLDEALRVGEEIAAGATSSTSPPTRESAACTCAT